MAKIRGTTLRDILKGTALADQIFGLAGNDDLFGGGGKDSLYGGAGNDKLDGGLGDDLLDGGKGKDTMKGGLGNDIYLVDNAGDKVTEKLGQGIDEVRTTRAVYTLGANLENLKFTGAGNFTGTGNGLNNKISGGAGTNTLNGGLGDDILSGATGLNHFFGGDGSDTADYTGATPTTLAADYSNTIAFVGRGKQVGVNVTIKDTGGTGLWAAEGDTFGSIENVTGTEFIDVIDMQIKGNAYGGGGDDRIRVIGTAYGGDGNDYINLKKIAFSDLPTGYGGAGDDNFISDRIGFDKAYGGDGRDLFNGYFGTEYGGAGSDVFALNGVTAYGGDGDDLFVAFGRTVGASSTIHGDAGSDTLSFGSGAPGQSVVASLAGGIATFDGGQYIFDGIENLDGYDAADTLTGDANANRFNGGLGNDTLTGGGGADTFIYRRSYEGDDTITDFHRSEGDKIDLSVLPGTFTYVGTGAFAGAGTPSVKIDISLGFQINQVLVDTDGDGSSNFIIKLTLAAGLLQATDFIL